MSEEPLLRGPGPPGAEGAPRGVASWPAIPVGSGTKQPWPYVLADLGETDWGTGQGPVLEPMCSLPHLLISGLGQSVS